MLPYPAVVLVVKEQEKRHLRFDLKIHWKLAPTDFGEAKSECGDAPLPAALKNLPTLLQQPGICLFAAFPLHMTVNMAQSPDFLVLA